jgi:hypothetical protein
MQTIPIFGPQSTGKHLHRNLSYLERLASQSLLFFGNTLSFLEIPLFAGLDGNFSFPHSSTQPLPLDLALQNTTLLGDQDQHSLSTSGKWALKVFCTIDKGQQNLRSGEDHFVDGWNTP